MISKTGIHRLRATPLIGALLVSSVLQLPAVLFSDIGDPTHNSSAPSGTLANSGWDFQGYWGIFLGTPVGPNHFIAATHIGGKIGDVFTLNGVQHTTTAREVDTGSDLTLWKVTPPFRNWAQLYTGNDEAGKRFVVFGRGTQRGAAVQANSLLGSAVKGWLWGPYDGVIRWGENRVADILDSRGNTVAGTLASGVLLRANFDLNGGANEAALSYGDSSGGTFINNGSGWKLAGVNYAVDGPYNTASSGAGFSASIVDEGGLYQGGEDQWALTPDLPSSQPGSFYITRISSRIAWIRSIIGDPGLPPAGPVLEYSTSLNAAFTEDNAAIFDPGNMLIRTPNPNQQRFFRVRAAQPMEITSLSREGSELVVRFRAQ